MEIYYYKHPYQQSTIIVNKHQSRSGVYKENDEYAKYRLYKAQIIREMNI